MGYVCVHMVPSKSEHSSLTASLVQHVGTGFDFSPF